MPDARTGEAVDDGRELFSPGPRVDELPAGLRRVDHLLGGALADTLGLSITVDLLGKDRRVALVDIVTDRLPDKMVRDCIRTQAMFLEDLPAPGAVAIIAEGLTDLEVVSPAGELDPIVAELLGLLAHCLKGQVSPLSCKKSYLAWHG